MKKIDYNDLNPKQKESYNFQKVSAVFADYGYTTYRMYDDLNGADFHAVGTKGDVIKVQLKARVSIDMKYLGKNIWIAFPENGKWYLYPHDDIYKEITSHSSGAAKNKARSIPKIPGWLDPTMKKYQI